VNTYLEESLSYTLEYKTTEDGEYQSLETAHTNVPQSDKAEDYNLAKNITIPAGETYYYKLTITFNNLPDINQEADRTAILSTKFNLGSVIKEKTAIEMIIASAKSGTPSFANVATTDEGVYSMQDDYGTSYYYRGAVENNYVKFGGFFWRIIRINGDGSLRMIYDGTQAYANAGGGNGLGGTDRFTHTGVAWNTTNYNDAKYVGWMYGGANGNASTSKSQAQTNETNTNIKTQVDSWYKTNIVDKGLSKYISDEIFCNDRSTATSSETWWTSDTKKGFGSDSTVYGGWSRFMKTDGSWNMTSPSPHIRVSTKE
ncbi:MAG TPA: hypothetical protein DCY94_02855, partial [Firmicutes bacterium]|nr:hypothetical protein [Bacillota bacterium]